MWAITLMYIACVFREKMTSDVMQKKWFEWLPYIVNNHYADFKGHAGGPEYWYSLLLYLAIILSGDALSYLTRGMPQLNLFIGFFWFLLFVFLLIPIWAVTIRSSRC